MAPLNGSSDVEAPYSGANGVNGTKGDAAIEPAYVDTRTGEHINVEKVRMLLSAVCTLALRHVKCVVSH
jgi:hypothetical protein